MCFHGFSSPLAALPESHRGSRSVETEGSISTSEKKKKALFVLCWPFSLFRWGKLSSCFSLTAPFGVKSGVWRVER